MRAWAAAMVLMASTAGVGAQDRYSGSLPCTVKNQSPRAMTLQCRGDLYDGWLARGEGTLWFGYVFCTRRGAVGCYPSMMVTLDMPPAMKLANNSLIACLQTADTVQCRHGANGWQ